MVRANIRMNGPPLRELIPQFGDIIYRHVTEHVASMESDYATDDKRRLLEKIHDHLLRMSRQWLKENLFNVYQNARLDLGMKVDPIGVRRAKDKFRW